MILDPDYLLNNVFLCLCHMLSHNFKSWDEKMNTTLLGESINYILHKIKSYVDTSQEKVNENILKTSTKSQFYMVFFFFFVNLLLIFKTPSNNNIYEGYFWMFQTDSQKLANVEYFQKIQISAVILHINMCFPLRTC